MTPEELHRKVFDELMEGSEQASYDAALIRVIAPYLHLHKPEDGLMFNNTSFQIGDLTIEMQTDGAALYGVVDIPRDKRGLVTARELKVVVDRICSALEREAADGALPETIVIQTPDTTKNPFE